MLPFDKFCKRVNELSLRDWQREGFAAQHQQYPKVLLMRYFKQGYTPRQVLNHMDAEARLENAWEARVS